MDITVRKYQPSDQSAVFEIAADTAFFGDPVEAFLDDRNLFTDAFARYYIEHEASLAWVAAGSGEVVGFLFGCADTTIQSGRWRRYIVGKVLAKALAGKYRLGKRTASFAWGMLASIFRSEEARVDFHGYPAHLQIDVRVRHRGEGVGKRLIEAYIAQLRQMKVDGVHLTTTSHNRAACHLYETVGFHMLDERLNRYWTRMLGFEVNNRSYGMKLG